MLLVSANGRRLLALATLCAVACGSPDEPGSTHERGATHESADATPVGRTRALPSTRVLRETAVRALSKEAMSRSFTGLTPKRIEGGIVKVNLEGRFQHASVAVIDEHGETRAGCVDGTANTNETQQAP